MSNTNKNVINRNASPSAYGWAFQVGAGIKLMLENVKEFTALKMEGKNDDIEITMPNGKIYAQAKSTTIIGNQSSANENLKDALATLSDDTKSGNNCIKLIYITNILNPFSTSQTVGPFYNQYDTSYDFSTLPPEDKQKIISIVGDNFPVEQLQVHIVKFFGEGNNKFDSIKNYIRSFVSEALGDASLSSNLFDKWYTLFSLNCTDKPKDEMSFDKTKKEIMYPVIVLAIDPPIPLEQFQKVSDYDDYDEIVQQYRDLINQRACEYDFTSALLGEYNTQKAKVDSANRANFKYDYVNNNWQQYEEAFNQIEDDEIRMAVTKLTLLTIIIKAAKLDRIHKAANIE